MKAYIDFHLHPSFKPYMSEYRETERRNCWENMPSPVAVARSQGNLSQLKKGNVRLAISCLYALERPLTSSFLLQHVAPKLTVLHKKMMHHPSYADYLTRLQEELKHLMDSARRDPAKGQTFKLLDSISEMDGQQLNLILAIEGAHCLEAHGSSMQDNLIRLKKGHYRFLYLTLTHMVQYPLCTHAYAMKLIRDNDQFKPKGIGLTKLGKEMVDIAYNDKNGHRIFIDIKHMSVVTRHQFYQYRREKGYENIPILATHMGVTGISRSPLSIVKYFSERAVRRENFIEVLYDRPKGIGQGWKDETFFNPWSINLYDEDIVEILDSGGLIGMNMDQRILGVDPVSGEYFSVEEFACILADYKTPKQIEEVPEGLFTDEPLAERKLKERKHVRHLCNNILHIVKTGGPRAWKQICIGSDFDGLIDPINTCTTAEEYPKLERELLENLPKMMQEDDTYDYDTSNIAKKVEGIMYGNALAFLQKHFV